jgi:hypothetical protein
MSTIVHDVKSNHLTILKPNKAESKIDNQAVGVKNTKIKYNATALASRVVDLKYSLKLPVGLIWFV